MRTLCSFVLMLSAFCAAADDPLIGLPLDGEEAVEFLRSAEVVGEPENFDSVAITDPLRVTLSDGQRTFRAIFKDENTLYPSFRFGNGTEVERVRDSYKHEIAAYELDALLGLGIVPPCIERTLFKRTGALCMWIEDAVDESARREKGLQPPDMDRWKNQVEQVLLFQQLINDLDHANIRNVVSDADFRLYKVDSSMGFYDDRKLRDESQITRFPREFLESLETLDRSLFDKRLGAWLYKGELKALWARRDRILSLAEKRVAERGETNVLY